MDAVEPNPPGAGAIGVEIGQRPHMAAGIPFLAGSRTGLAADADVEVDDEPELFLARPRLRQRRHAMLLCARRPRISRYSCPRRPFGERVALPRVDPNVYMLRRSGGK